MKAGGMEPNSWHAHMQANAPSPQHYKLNENMLLSNFDFLHYTQILHSLKEQGWAFNPPLWASRPILNDFIGKTFPTWLPGVERGILTIFGPILAILEDFFTEKEKKCMPISMCSACMHACAHGWTFLIYSGDQSWNMLKVSWRSDFIWLRYWSVLPL